MFQTRVQLPPGKWHAHVIRQHERCKLCHLKITIGFSISVGNSHYVYNSIYKEDRTFYSISTVTQKKTIKMSTGFTNIRQTCQYHIEHCVCTEPDAAHCCTLLWSQAHLPGPAAWQGRFHLFSSLSSINSEIKLSTSEAASFQISKLKYCYTQVFALKSHLNI